MIPTTTRLVFADWLEEHGNDLRGSFIRAQIEHARLSRNDPAWGEFNNRQHELYLQYDSIWRAALPPWAACLRLGLWRGFGGAAFTTIPNFLKQASRLFRLEPIQYAHFEIHQAGHLARLLQSRHVTKLRGLAFGHLISEPESQAIRQISESTQRGDLVHLSFAVLSPDSARRLVSSRHLGNLRTVYLSARRHRRYLEEGKEVERILEKRFTVEAPPI
jgi:hypothetical protein